jgi:hypothetical protein
VTWESFYLGCFLTGLLLTVVTFIFGVHLHLPVHVHLPSGWHLPHLSAHHGDGVPPLNLTTLVMFLTWFGGTGYLMTRYHSAAASLAFLAALIVGFVGGAVMYLFMARVFFANERPLRASDFDMLGVLGRLSVPIRAEDGTGELIYSQQGTRRSCGARSDDGRSIERGIEVVVLRYENGIAYVRPWQEVVSEQVESLSTGEGR